MYLPPMFGILNILNILYYPSLIKKIFFDKKKRYMEDVIKLSGLTRSKCTEYLNVLVNGRHVVKLSQKGQLFKLNPEKYSIF